MKQYIHIIVILFFVITTINAQENDYFLKGLAKYKYQEYDSAIYYFTGAINKDKSNNRFFIYRGECYLIKNELEKAKSDYINADNLLTGCGSYAIAKICAMQNDFSGAIKWLEKNLKSKYKEAKSEIRTNKAFVKLRETQEWKDLWSKDWYTEEEITIESADYLKQRKKYVDALEELDKIIFNDKHNAHLAFFKRAEVYLLLNDKKNALNDLNNAIKINNDVYKYHYKRALLLLDQRKFKKSLIDFNKAIELNKENFEAFYHRAIVKSKLQMSNEAIKDLEYYLRYMTKNEIAYYKGGVIYLDIEEYAKALSWLTTAINMNSNKIEYFIARAKAYEGLENYLSMQNDCSRALDINPREGEVYYKRGIAKYNMKDIEGACKDWRNAVRFDYFEANEFLLNECQ